MPISLPQSSSVEMQAPDPPKRPCVKALFDYRQKTARELSMRKGDIMFLLNASNKVTKIELATFID